MLFEKFFEMQKDRLVAQRLEPVFNIRFNTDCL